MPTTAIYLLVSIIAAPPLVKLGINPLAEHMHVFYFGIVSLITHPWPSPPLSPPILPERVPWQQR